MNCYGDIGPKLVERGYAAIPVLPGTKYPGHRQAGEWTNMPGWNRYADRPPTSFEVGHWETTAGDGGVCVVMGRASSDLIGIDIDVDDAPIVAAIKSAIGDSPVRKKGQKGETLFFRGPGITSCSFDEYLPDGRRGRRLCDVIGPGRQTVLPPSIHPDTGQPYRWIGHAALDAIDPADLPELPSDVLQRLAAALKPFGYDPERQAPARPQGRRAAVPEGDETPHRALNNAAMADLAAWVPRLGLWGLQPRRGGYVAVATWRPSTTGRSTERRGKNLKIHPDGIVDFHDGERRYTPLDLIQAANGCDLDTAFRGLSEWLGRVPEMSELQPRATKVVDGHIADAETGEILDAEPQGHVDAVEARDFPDADLYVPGLVGEIADWIMATSPKPIRLFAVAAAITTVGTIIGRQIYCGTPRSGANLYMMLVAGTGGGKERPQEAVRQILDAVGGERMHAAESSSIASLGLRLSERPSQVQIVDEIDRILRKVSQKHASSQEVELLQAYCTLWGKGQGTYIPTSVTTRGDILIKRPALGILGATTFHAFYEHMRAKMLANGFLNRFLVLPKFERVAFAENVEPEDVIPSRIVELCTRLARFQDAPPDGVDAKRYMPPSSFVQNAEMPPGAFIVEMTAGAADLYRAARARDETMLRTSDEDPMLEAWVRASEMAKRIALVVACGRYAEHGLDGVEVEEGDIVFAQRLVDWSIAHFIAGLRENMAENDHQANAKMVLRFIRKGGADGISRSKLYRAVDSKMNSRDLDMIIKELDEAKKIVSFVAPTTSLTGGRPKTIYKAR